MDSLTIVSPGVYPIPSSVCSSVEICIMNMLPYLAKSFHVRVIGRNRAQARSSLADIPFMAGKAYPNDRLQFTQLDASSPRKYAAKVIADIQRHRPTWIQVENQPAFVNRIKKAVPEARIWLNIHSVRAISAKRFRPRLIKRVFRQCEGIVVNSHFLKHYLLARYPETQTKIVVNHLGVNADFFQPKQVARDHPLGNGPVILFVGRMIRKKGIHHLLSAMKRIRAQYPDVKLLIIGSSRYGWHKQTPYTHYVNEMINDIGDSVIFQPHVPHEHLPYWYSLSDVFVCPSAANEAFGLVNAEAMACQLPVIATDSGGIPEVVFHNETGIVVPRAQRALALENALVQILANPHLATQMGVRGREHVRHRFTWQQSAQRLINEYTILRDS